MIFGFYQPARPVNSAGRCAGIVRSVSRRCKNDAEAHGHCGSSLTHDGPCPVGLKVGPAGSPALRSFRVRSMLAIPLTVNLNRPEVARQLLRVSVQA